MVISLTCLVDNFAEKIHDSKCKDCKSALEYLNNEDNFFIFKCFKRTKSHKKNSNKGLVKRFAHI